MIALAIAFPAGRFHATPWDRSVNEGDVEWPPSPWRLLRALVAGYHVVGDTDHGLLDTVLDRLAEPPWFLLPPATAAHTRHYMPDGASSRVLVLDAFVALEREAVAYIVWDNVELSVDQRRVLAVACNGISYLGRAESWCRIAPTVDVPSDDGDLKRVDLAQRRTTAGQHIRRLGPAADCRGPGLREALSSTTAEMRKARRMLPDGASWLDYRFEEGFGLTPTLEIRARRSAGLATSGDSTLRFALDGRAAGLRPRITETLVVAEAFRSAAMARYSARSKESVPSTLSGKSDVGVLRGHEHAYFLPVDLDGDGLLDHIDVRFPRQIDHETFLAVSGVARLWDWRLGRDETYVTTFLGMAPAQSGRIWRSRTPFILGAHPRSRGSDARRERYSPEAQIERALAEGHFPRAKIELRSDRTLQNARGGSTPLSAFRARRKDDRMIGVPISATLHFDEDIRGPLSIGRYAHFGLGQFVEGPA